MKQFVALSILIAFLSICASGCGETLNGISKDISRQGKGIKTIFVRDDQ